MVEQVHHIDFVVRDLDRAAARYAEILGMDPGPRERLESRGVELVRFRVGVLWLILVQPVREDSPVMRFLEEHGEGFFHIAYRVDDVAAEAARLKAVGVEPVNEIPRRGVEGWKLVDLRVEDTAGILTQPIEEG